MTTALFLLALISPARAQVPRESTAERRNGVIQNPTAQQRRSSSRGGLRTLSPSTSAGSIQSAIDQPPTGPLYLYLSCGIYTENIVISRSDIRIEGEERGCVQILPADPTLPAVSIDATAAGVAGIGYDELSDLTIFCTGTCSDGLRITGRTDIDQPNDWHKFSRLGVYGGFKNGINITGRTIWTEFTNVEVARIQGNGITIVGSAAINHLAFRNVRSGYNDGYGIYVNSTHPYLINGLLLDQVNVEYNGMNSSLPDCAGIYLTGISHANIANSYFEANCNKNKSPNPAEIRLTGTFNQSVNISDCVFELAYTESGIYNDSVLTTGTYDGNKFSGSGNNDSTITIATHHALSNIMIGQNYGATPKIVVDKNGLSHVRMLSPLGLDLTAITSVTGNTVDVANKNGILLFYGPYTIDHFTGGQPGQLLYVLARTAGGHVLTSDTDGIGSMAFPDQMNRTLQSGESLFLYNDGYQWRPIEGAINSQSRYIGTITTTTAASDTLVVPGLSSDAHCTYAATNSVAGDLTSLYITVQAGTVSLFHSSKAGGTFNVFCSSK